MFINIDQAAEEPLFRSFMLSWEFVWLFLQELRDSDIFLAELEHPCTQVVSAVSYSLRRTEPGPELNPRIPYLCLLQALT